MIYKRYIFIIYILISKISYPQNGNISLDNFNIYENGCENNYVELVRSTEDELVYRSTYYAGSVHDLTCAEMELQDLPTNPQLITWSVKNNVMTVEHENEQSISTILTLVDEFDPGCFD